MLCEFWLNKRLTGFSKRKRLLAFARTWLMPEVTHGACSFTADSGNVNVTFAACTEVD